MAVTDSPFPPCVHRGGIGPSAPRRVGGTLPGSGKRSAPIRLVRPRRIEAPWLDRTSPLPLHAQLRTAIDRRIASGEWAERLPAERRLCAMFGVSRLTLRRALRQLAADGQLVTQHGSGNYVM